MKFQPSAIAATSLSGKSGGTVATKTNTFRRKSNPRQPNSSAQMTIRARFSSLSTGWGTLTENEQDAWIAAAPNFVFVDNGETYTLKGNTLYQKLNNNLLRAEQSVITLPPLPGTFPMFSISSAVTTKDGDDNFAILSTNETIDMDGYTVIGFACQPQNPGKRALANLTTEAGPMTWDDDQISFFEDYPSFFTSWTTGKRVELGMYLINNTTGQASEPQTMQSVIIEI